MKAHPMVDAASKVYSIMQWSTAGHLLHFIIKLGCQPLLFMYTKWTELKQKAFKWCWKRVQLILGHQKCIKCHWSFCERFKLWSSSQQVNKHGVHYCTQIPIVNGTTFTVSRRQTVFVLPWLDES